MEFKTAQNTRHALVPVCIAAAVLQVALAPQLAILGGRINFMLVLVATAALAGDSRRLVYLGFGAGLFYDLTAAVPVGLMALLLAVAGYLTALGSRGLSGGITMESLRAVGVTVIAVNIIYALALFFLGIEGDLLVAIGGHGLASSVFDILVAVPFLLALGGGEQGRGFTARGRHGSRGMRYKGIR